MAFSSFAKPSRRYVVPARLNQDKLMKFFNGTLFIRSIAAVAIIGLTACASLQSSPSSLPLATVGDQDGKIFSARVTETANRLYVAGQAKPHRLRTSTHVDVQLLDAQGRVIAEKSDTVEPVNPRTRHARGGKVAYVISFSKAEAQSAKSVRVIYHDESHS